MKNKLSEHFALEEFTRSATAPRLGICNEPGTDAISNLQCLCQEVLEPLREHAGVPIIVSSGFRCRRLNKAVGGVTNSQHCTGEAADIHLPDNETGREWFDYIARHLTFDQLIWEHTGGTVWIHVSYRREYGKNRRQVLTKQENLYSVILQASKITVE